MLERERLIHWINIKQIIYDTQTSELSTKEYTFWRSIALGEKNTYLFHSFAHPLNLFWCWCSPWRFSQSDTAVRWKDYFALHFSPKLFVIVIFCLFVNHKGCFGNGLMAWARQDIDLCDLSAIGHPINILTVLTASSIAWISPAHPGIPLITMWAYQ